MRVLATALVLLVSGSAFAQTPLAVDLAARLVPIHASFTGAEVLLFGAVQDRGDVVIVVSGPPTRARVRKKVRAGGVWVNGRARELEDVPTYYAVASSAPLDAIASRETFEDLGIGLVNVLPGEEDATEYRDGLVEAFARRGLYSQAPYPIVLQDGGLFRTTIRLPAETPPGGYGVDTFLLRDGELVARRRATVLVQRVGIDALLYDFAHAYPALYGVLAIAAALLAGTAAAEVFRRV